MKKKYQITRNILHLLFLFAIINIVSYGQEIKQNSTQAEIIGLPQGCKLFLDTTVVTTDSLSIEIINEIREIMPRIQAFIPADSITINLAKNSSEVLPMFGVGGRTTSDHSISFYFDPENPNFSVEFLVSSLVHECFHPTRLRMPHWKLTLLECMITEGLADHFMVEILNCEQPVWSQALSEEEIQEYMVKAKTILFVKHEIWTEEFTQKYFVPWMFGRKGDNPIPGWTGYSLGWRIVENYLKEHPEARASTLVFTPAEEIAGSTTELIAKQ